MPGKFARIMEARIKAHILLANLGEKYIAGSCRILHIPLNTHLKRVTEVKRHTYIYINTFIALSNNPLK